MEILIGINLLIILIAVVASEKFSSLASSKGYPSRRAKKYPYYIAAGALFFNILGQTLLSFGSRSMMTLLFCCWGGLIVMVLTAILVKAYKNIKVAPDASTGELNRRK